MSDPIPNDDPHVDSVAEPAVGRWSPWPLLGVSACFALPAATFAWLFASEAPNGWNVMLPIAAALGAGLTAFVLWLSLGWVGENVLFSAGLGVGVGVLAHPVTAVLALLVAMAFSLLGLLPDPGNGNVNVDDPLDVLKVFALIAFFWCVLSLFGPLYVTIGLGLFTGLIVGGMHMAFRRSANASSPDAPNAPPWSSLPANLASLAGAGLISALLVWVANQ